MFAMAFSASSQTKDLFNHLGAGAAVGTNGISVELATPITKFVTLRAGASFMPGISFNANADYTFQAPNTSSGTMEARNGEVKLKGDFGRVQGQVVFNVYPAPKIPLYVAVGGYFGGDKLLKITGHSPELANPE